MYRVETITVGGQGSPFYTRHHFREEDGVGDQTGAQLAANAVALFWTEMGTSISDELTHQIQSDVLEIDPVTGQQTASYAVTINSPQGQNTDERLAYATQGLLRYRTGVFVNGREVRGRTYIPGPVETANGGGVPLSGYLDQLNEAGAALIAAEPQFVIWSAPAEAIVTSASAWSQWAVLRTRRD